MEIPVAAVDLSFITSTFSFSFVPMKSHRALKSAVEHFGDERQPGGCHDEEEINSLVWKKADQEHKQRKIDLVSLCQGTHGLPDNYRRPLIRYSTSGENNV